jgi:hypothetical protein
VTATVALPDFVRSCVDVATTVCVPADAGLKTPELLTLPKLDCPSDQTTELSKLPVPATVDVQVEVWLVRIEDGEHTTDTEVIVAGALAVIVAEPDLEVS